MRQHAWLIPVVAVIVIAIGLRVAFTWTSLSYLPATSDEASSVQLAKMIADGAWPLLFIGQPYQFPIESYLMAPLVDWMPANAVGARYQALLLGLITTGVMLYTAHVLYPAGRRWPSVLLILLPSAYWLQHQSGYTPPQYAMTALLSSLVFLYTVKAIRPGSQRRFILLAGFFAGLLISNHMLGLSVVAGATSLFTMQAVREKSLRALYRYVAGMLVGLIPYLLAIALIEGAYDSVTDSVSADKAWLALMDSTLTQTVPGVMGIQPVLFTDIYTHLDWGGALRLPMLLVLVVILFLIAWGRLHHGLVSVARRRIPEPDPVDMFLIAMLFAILMFVFSSRAYPEAYRFLLVVVWCFPFLVGYLYANANIVSRSVIAVFAVAYASVNAAASADKISKWGQPDAGVKAYSHTHDLKPLLDYLDENDIDRCYASFWIAYRVTFESDGRIVCVQPFNERFHRWPLPGTGAHDGISDVPYIVMDSNRSELSTEMLRYHLGRSGIEHKQTDVGPFRVFDSFSSPVVDFERLLPMSAYQVTSLGGASSDIANLHDGDIGTYWTSQSKQEKWTGLEITLNEPQKVMRLTLRYNEDAIELPKMVWIYAQVNGEWKHVKKVWHRLSPVDYVSPGQLVYGGYQKIVRFDDLPPVQSLRLVNAIPDYGDYWSIAELEIIVEAED